MPIFTGVPPHVLLMAEMSDLNIQINNLQDSLGGVFENILDERIIGSPKLFTKIMDQTHRMQLDLNTRMENMS